MFSNENYCFIVFRLSFFAYRLVSRSVNQITVVLPNHFPVYSIFVQYTIISTARYETVIHTKLSSVLCYGFFRVWVAHGAALLETMRWICFSYVLCLVIFLSLSTAVYSVSERALQV